MRACCVPASRLLTRQERSVNQLSCRCGCCCFLKRWWGVRELSRCRTRCALRTSCLDLCLNSGAPPRLFPISLPSFSCSRSISVSVFVVCFSPAPQTGAPPRLPLPPPRRVASNSSAPPHPRAPATPASAVSLLRVSPPAYASPPFLPSLPFLIPKLPPRRSR